MPYPGAKMADGSPLLTGSDSEAWRDWRRVMLRSPNELQEVIAREGRVAPHTDPVLKRKPQFYARLVWDVSLRGLVSFEAPSEATVGVFVVPKKPGELRLIFDTRRVNQHFRRPWHRVLPTPASWAGLQLPVDSAYHLIRTDVNTATSQPPKFGKSMVRARIDANRSRSTTLCRGPGHVGEAGVGKFCHASASHNASNVK